MLAMLERDDGDVFATMRSEIGYDDHSAGDRPIEDRVEVTRGGLVNLAIAASRVGARYEREGICGDPVDWLLSPHEVFDGECAVDACIDVAPVLRCVALHAEGNGFGLDAAPEAVDELLASDDQAAGAGTSKGPRYRYTSHGARAFAAGRHIPEDGSGPRLYSCSLMRVEPGARVATFVAGVAPDESEFRRRLFERYGAMAALSPDVRAGFDQYDPVAVALVSEPLADWLSIVAADPMRCGDAGFDVVVEHRLRA